MSADSITQVSGQTPQIPSHMIATSANKDWQRPRSIFLSVESREAKHPEKQEYLDKTNQKALKSLEERSFPVVTDSRQAAFQMTLVEAPNIRYGPYHYQDAPYVYLLLRERPSGQLVYCAFRRMEHFRDVTSALLLEWKSALSTSEIVQTGSLEECAQQAMRQIQNSDLDTSAQ